MRKLLLFIFFLFNITCFKLEEGKKDFETIVFKHGKVAGDYNLFKNLIAEFEKENLKIKVKDETLPSSTDEQHQFYVINLEGRTSDFDVLSMDVIWVPEFAKAGWLRDLTHLLSDTERKDFFSGPMQAVNYKGRIYAIPWYIDAGLLYYRKDLLEKYGFSPPSSYDELIKIAQVIISNEKELYGFIWQGKQYEGLVCVALEFFWGNGGDVLKDGKVVISSPENVYALSFMRDLISKYKITPHLVTTCTEEVTRHIFGSGKAVFMRNWPYAWNIFERDGSPVKGKVGVCPLPSLKEGISNSTLGGWQLGINRYSKHPDSAERFVKFLTSDYAQKRLSLTVGYKPSKKSLYKDKEFKEKQPFISSLYNIFLNAKPRPISPYYMMISQVLQIEFSSAISGIKRPDEALKSAKMHIDHILEVEK